MRDCLILCATTRLAQTLRGELLAGRSAWPTQAALTIGQWLAELADEAQLSGSAELPNLLDPFAERLLWERIIADGIDPAVAPLFDLQGMAASAVEAHALSQVWKIKAVRGSLSDEARFFAGWQNEFLKHCRGTGWLDLVGLHLRIIALLEAGCFALPERIRFAGFDRLTPLEMRLMTALSGRGVVVDCRAESTVESSQCQVLAQADIEAECAAVAAWVDQQMARNPQVRLGIVAPDLAAVRDRLEFRLDDVLHPTLIRPDAADLPRCFNFSLGRPLADLPLIRIALDLLAIGAGHAKAKVEQSRFSALLLAGGWSAALAEADGRARFDTLLRRDLPYFTTLFDLLRLAERHPSLCPQTIAALSALAETGSSGAHRMLPGEWSSWFGQTLQAAGWPGDRALSSPEFQARRAFGEVLDSFGQFDALLGPLRQGEAVRRLSQLCRQRIFQPETRGQPSVHVLGMLESAGLKFDALWVMGMNDDVWPPPPRPNPLLPAELLRAAGAAHASAEVELDFATRVQARLVQAAPVVNFSFSLAAGNRLLRCSPLLAGLPRLTEQPPVGDLLAHQLLASSGAALEHLSDACAPPVGSGEKVSGGSWLLRAQAICPAWAYFQFRLGADALSQPVEGLDPADRGTLVHAALEAFWLNVKNSRQLGALDAAAREQVIKSAVESALQHFEKDRKKSFPRRFRQLEAGRLLRLLERWLAVEAKRSIDFEVMACEERAEVAIEDIRVGMVVDRIDRLLDGRQVIIDYKTGLAIDVKNWASQRISEPQLPIYAALVNDEVAAVVFAKVLLDKPGFSGVAGEKDIFPGVHAIGDDKQKIFSPAEFPDWIAVVTHWRERLHAMACEVKAGVAGVMFAEEAALQYCPVLPLLRLPERRRLLAAALAGERA